MLVYKILLPAEWERFDSCGQFDGSPFDMQSGFVHCSSRSQLAATAGQYFANDPNLVVLAVDSGALGETLRWEPAANGDQYPHIYGPIPKKAVVAVHHVGGADGVDEALKRREQ